MKLCNAPAAGSLAVHIPWREAVPRAEGLVR